MTDTPGICGDVDDPSTLISEISLQQASTLKRRNYHRRHDSQGGLLHCRTGGRSREGIYYRRRIPHALLIEILTDEGIGTMFIKGIDYGYITELDKRYIANTYARFPVVVASGKGSIITDIHGNKYIDLGTGISVTHSVLRMMLGRMLL